MADQLQEMLQKIYTEGVDKAKAEAEKIMQNALEQSDKVKSEAKIEAERIIKEARQNAEELDKKLHSDLKMAAQQAMSALKNKVVNAVMVETADKQASQAMSDIAFVQKIILEVLGKWSPQSSLILTVPENKKNELDDFLKNSVKSVFAGTLKVDFRPVMKNGISIAPADGSYKLNFTDEDFANFFKSYLRPKAVQILFGE
jgi:V/A-type H+/Na+-transporting ATPase subunit E